VGKQIRWSNTAWGHGKFWPRSFRILEISFSSLLSWPFSGIGCIDARKRSSHLPIGDPQLCGEGFIFHFGKPFTVRIAQSLITIIHQEYCSVNFCHWSRAEGRPPAVRIRHHQELILLANGWGSVDISKTVGAQSRLNPLADTFF
jgi:hypothetical protein